MPLLDQPRTTQRYVAGQRLMARCRPKCFPGFVDSEPAVLRMKLPGQTNRRADIRTISWEAFFIKFDSLGLAFVYDDAPTGYNEILQQGDKSPYRHPR